MGTSAFLRDDRGRRCPLPVHRELLLALWGIVVCLRERMAIQMFASTVLVTGGLVGSRTCKAYACIGHQPTVYDNLPEGFREAVKRGPLEVRDLRDEARLAEDAVSQRTMGVLHLVGVLHLAVFEDTGRSVQQPAITAIAFLGTLT